MERGKTVKGLTLRGNDGRDEETERKMGGSVGEEEVTVLCRVRREIGVARGGSG